MVIKTANRLWAIFVGGAALLALAGASCTAQPSLPAPNAALSTIGGELTGTPPPPAPTFTPDPTRPVARQERHTATAQPLATPASKVCSPLQGFSFAALATAISNPFAPPPLGSDDPHQGVDLADRLPGSELAIEGRPVQAVLSGKVAGVVADRFPYGNAVMIETSLAGLPASLNLAAAAPWLGAPFPTPSVHSSLTCPSGPGQAGTGPTLSGKVLSLYLLYAHMQQPPVLEAGAAVDCGTVIGAVGSSGNALSPHLHLEARLGPPGMKFISMAHYDSSATLDEMASYCNWRTSGSFIPVDPLLLLPASP